MVQTIPNFEWWLRYQHYIEKWLCVEGDYRCQGQPVMFLQWYSLQHVSPFDVAC
jgi:hypothetical protein